jgi:hypothetical protein
VITMFHVRFLKILDSEEKINDVLETRSEKKNEKFYYHRQKGASKFRVTRNIDYVRGYHS